jgi:murein L,D-transpeptidase YcbB/YkuD
MIRLGPVLPAAAIACFCVLSVPALADPATVEDSPQAETKTTPDAPDGSAAEKASGPKAPETTPATAAAAPATEKAEPPAATSALPDSAAAEKSPADNPQAADATPVAPHADPVIEAIRQTLVGNAALSGAYPEQIAALKSFYAERTKPLWIKDGKFGVKAAAAIAVIKRADDYGLEASSFDLPVLSPGADAASQADAELKLDVAALKYAHFARGGRLNPVALSNILDMQPPVKDPAVVLNEIAAASEPDVYLRDQNPKHPQFELLRQALLKARGPKEEPVDEALSVKIPDTNLLKPGDQSPVIALVRKRLKVEAARGTNPHYYDSAVELAVEAFQKENGLRPDGYIGSRTRRAMNGEADRQNADPTRQIDRIIANMERWRWLPRNLGPLYVMNNIPEFKSRVMKGDEELLEQKIIVGQPSWPTPVLTAKMQSVVFRPSWGVPNGIKMKELLPRLQRASGGNNFFDQLFGGGSSGGSRVLQAYKLQPSLNGRPVDPDSINWNNVDIRRFDFVQPPGSENPLGKVKFLFPNRHDVYMHDTPQRALFAQSFRALSHGCMRLDQPQRTAEVLLEQDKGWSSARVDDMYDSSSAAVALEKPIPVYLTYFTLVVGKDGEINRFGDIYGHDQRVSSALAGRPVRYEAPEDNDFMASDDDDAVPVATQKKSSNKKTARNNRPSHRTAGDILADSLSGLISN